MGSAGVLKVNTAGLSLPAAVTVPSAARIEINTTQTTWPTTKLTVEKHGSLTGDMTMADFAPVTGNVELQEGAIFAPIAGTGAPTLVQLGGTAILYESVTTSNKTLSVGDNGTTIYKGAAFDDTYGSYRMSGVSVTANPNSGPLQLLFAGANLPQVSGTEVHGDGSVANGTTADILFDCDRGTGYQGIIIHRAFNWEFRDDYAAYPTLIRTFNVSGKAVTDTVLKFTGGDDKILDRTRPSTSVMAGFADTNNLTGAMPGTLKFQPRCVPAAQRRLCGY